VKIGIDCTMLQVQSGRHGVGSYLRGLLGGLARVSPGHDYRLIAYPGTLDAGDLPPSFRLARVSAPSLGKARALISHQVLLPAMSRRLKLDVLHIPVVSMNASLPGIPLARAVPVVVTVQDLMPLRFPEHLLPHRRHRVFYRAMLAAVRRARHVLCTSTCTREQLLADVGLPAERITVAPLAADPCFSTAEVAPGDARASALANRAFVLHVGGLQPMKNLPRLAAAMTRLWAEGHSVDLVCVGAAPMAPTGLIPEGHRHRLIALDDVQVPFLRWLYQRARVLAIPSLAEGFGLPVLEAMASGCPVVAGRTGSLPEVGGDAARYVDSMDVNDIAAGLGAVLGDKPLLDALRARGLLRAAEFGYDRTARATLEGYERASAR
jgi:glycosyltransferase involved in cell wall biosynthesis